MEYEKGTLQMYDSGGKFIREKDALQCLADYGCDICIYSFTPQGHTAPVHLIVKMTMPGCMNRYLDGGAQSRRERAVGMLRLSYDKTEAMILFDEMLSMRSALYARLQDPAQDEDFFSTDMHRKPYSTSAQYFFGEDADPGDPNSDIYLRDRTFFLNAQQKKKTLDAVQKGTLQFLDAGGKFSSAQYNVRKYVNQGCDICVYSVTVAGNTKPKYIVVKATMPGCMDAYLRGAEADREARCTAMVIMDYETSSPAALGREAQSMMYCVQGLARSSWKDEAYFSRFNGRYAEAVTAHGFFLADAIPGGPNSAIYQQDQAHFLPAERNRYPYRGRQGTLSFSDSGNRFAGIRAELEKLTAHVCDAGVYSLTVRGKPKYLYVKVTLPGCMDAYLGDAAGREERCVYMMLFDYDKEEPANVAEEISGCAHDVYTAVKEHGKDEAVFIGRLTDHDGRMEAQEFFSIQAEYGDPNTAVYQRDGAHFIGRDQDAGRYRAVPGKLSFRDAGRRYAGALPGLLRLSERGCDVSVYSVNTVQGASPSRLIVRVMLPGCMNAYWSIWKTKPHERCAALEIVDYEGTDLASIADKACALRDKVYACASALLNGVSVRPVCTGTDEADMQAYFSFDAAEGTPNADAYRVDKMHFIEATPVVHKTAPRLDAGFTGVRALADMTDHDRIYRHELMLAPDIVTDTTNMDGLFRHFKKITSLDLAPLSTAGVQRMAGMFRCCESLEALNLSGFDTSAVTDMSEMFRRCIELRQLDISAFDVRRVTDMSRMFEECRKLASLNLSGFDTAQVTSMKKMFESCGALETLDLSSFNTSRTTNMENMFAFCTALREISLPSFDTRNVTSMRGLFRGCRKLGALNLSALNTERVTDMAHMFSQCESLTKLDLSGFDTAQVTSMFMMFAGCERLTELDLSAFDTARVTSMYHMFERCRKLQRLDLSGFDFSGVTNLEGIFTGCTGLREVILSDTLLKSPCRIERVIKEGRTYTREVLGEGNTPSHAYENRYIATITEGRETQSISLSAATKDELRRFLGLGENVEMIIRPSGAGKEIKAAEPVHQARPAADDTAAPQISCRTPAQKPVSRHDDAKADSLYGEYAKRADLTHLNLSGLDTARATKMDRMFDECTGLVWLNLSGFDTSQVTGMSGMFNGCESLQELDLSSFDTSKVKTMWCMFHRCKSLKKLDLSGFDTSAVTDMSVMFRGCSSLESLNVSSFRTSAVTRMTEMFSGCENLTELDLSSFDFSRAATNMMLSGCRRLTVLYLPEALRGEPQQALRQRFSIPNQTRIVFGRPADRKQRPSVSIEGILKKLFSGKKMC